MHRDRVEIQETSKANFRGETGMTLKQTPIQLPRIPSRRGAPLKQGARQSLTTTRKGLAKRADSVGLTDQLLGEEHAIPLRTVIATQDLSGMNGPIGELLSVKMARNGREESLKQHHQVPMPTKNLV